MIILAVAIILSLSSSGIIERANEAKEKTNTENLKEKNKLEAQGIDASTLVITDDDEILVGLTPVAVKFIEEGVPVGAYVMGYDLSSNTNTTYTTSGNEYTSPMGVEGNPTKQDISRVSGSIWRYIGVSKTGKALITLEVVDGLPKLELGGKGGYLNGPKELDDACEALYSSDMGKARSIDYDDVVNALDYTGKVGPYTSKNGMTKYLTEKKTIRELIDAGEKELTITAPDGGSVDNLYVEGGSISYTDQNIKAGALAKDVIFTEESYWLASHHNIVDFKNNYIEYCIQQIMGSAGYENSGLCTITMLYSGSSYVNEMIVRPVVELAPNLNVSYSGQTATISK